MPDLQSQMPDPDRPSDGPEDALDRGLRELQASPDRKSRFTEPKAARRSRKAVGDVRRRESRKARKLREPVRSAGATGRDRPRSASGRKVAGRERGQGRKGVDKHGYTRSTRAWVTSFAPGSTQSVGTVIRVHGFMTAQTARDSGRRVLRISYNYLFVYPVQRPGLPLSRMRVVAHRTGSVDFAPWSDPHGPLEAWWLPGDSGAAGTRCDARDGYAHPDFPASRPDTARPSGPLIHPYDLNWPTSAASCQAVAGT